MSITWYEWIGWIVEALLIAIAMIFLISTFSEVEIRPILVSILGSGLFVGSWTWVMVKYGK